jgi:uncharacterized membrane protein
VVVGSAVAAVALVAVALQGGGDMGLQRLLKHALLPGWWFKRKFPAAALKAIEAAITDSETTHGGELRFVIEGPLSLHLLLHGQSPRHRAIDLFSQLRVWDTAHNSGVLIYVQLIDRRVEIIADRGIAARVPQAQWSEICRAMEDCFRIKAWRRGALEAIDRVGKLLALHFPNSGKVRNELPDRPVVLG